MKSDRDQLVFRSVRTQTEVKEINTGRGKGCLAFQHGASATWHEDRITHVRRKKAKKIQKKINSLP